MLVTLRVVLLFCCDFAVHVLAGEVHHRERELRGARGGGGENSGDHDRLPGAQQLQRHPGGRRRSQLGASASSRALV